MNNKVDESMWNVLKGIAKRLQGVVKNLFKLDGYPNVEMEFDAMSLFKTKKGYTKNNHCDAPGYIPIVACYYVNIALKNKQRKGLGFDTKIINKQECHNPNMCIFPLPGEIIIFYGILGDIIQHTPVGESKQLLVTFRFASKKYVLRKQCGSNQGIFYFFKLGNFCKLLKYQCRIRNILMVTYLITILVLTYLINLF